MGDGALQKSNPRSVDMKVASPSIRVTIGSQTHQGPPPGPLPEGTAEPHRAFTPLIDIHEGPDGLLLEADLPGATESNMFIQLEDNVLSLHARIESPAPEGAPLLHEEYHVGDYHRSFILSDEVDRERIKAELKNGVLCLTLPKADRARTRRIEIRS
jgi:HSP20 family molecular chaperone IbpA